MSALCQVLRALASTPYITVRRITSLDAEQQQQDISNDRECDAEQAVHVRWADADRMRATLQSRSSTHDAPSWLTLALQASRYEQLLLTPQQHQGAPVEGVRTLAKGFSQQGAVLALGVSTRYAALVCKLDVGTENASSNSMQVYACAISRSPTLEWYRSKLCLQEAPLASHLYGSEMLLVTPVGHIAIYTLPKCRHAAFNASIRISDNPVIATFNAQWVVTASGRDVDVWQRTMTPGNHTLTMHHVTVGAVASAVSIDVSSESVQRFVVGLADGTLQCFQIVTEANNAILGPHQLSLQQPLVKGLEFDATAAVRWLDFSGARFVLATAQSLVMVDLQRGRDHHCGGLSTSKEHSISTPCSVTFWGDAAVVHDVTNNILVYDFRSGHLVRAFLSEKMRHDVTRPQGHYQSLAVAGDQVATLLPDGTLVFIDLD